MPRRRKKDEKTEAGASGRKGQRNEMRMITRAVAVLRVLADSPSGLSLGQIAKATGLARATVQRLVGALETEQLVSTSANHVGVRLGVELARLGTMVHKDIRQIIRPHLERLHSRIEDTIDLTILVEGNAVVIDQVVSTMGLRVVSYIGLAMPLHCTASGKSHLTQMERGDAVQYLTKPLKRYTPYSTVDAAPLLALIGTVDANICQIDREEYAEGVSAMGLPIRGLVGGNYAIAISMPTFRFANRLDFLCEELRACQAAVEHAAGVR